MADLPTVADPAHVERAWEFYRSIGSPKYICAPMVNQSELPFRLLCRKYKTELCYTPMINSGCFARDPKYRAVNFTPCAEDRPLVAQFAGDDPETILAAALHVQDHVDAVDLNLGCPQDIARRGHYGSFLLEETALIEAIVRTLVRGLKVPVTVKIRLLQAGLEPTLHLCRVIQAAGASILTVHGRTRAEKKQEIRAANWDAIRAIKREMLIPVFANGGIENFDDIQRCLDHTGADGVMSSEALLEFPALFANIPYSVAMQDQLAAEHLALARVHYEFGPVAVRAHLFKYLYTGLQVHTDLRDMLSNSNTMEEFEVVARTLRERRAAHEYTCTSPETCGQPHSVRKWYRRYLSDDGQPLRPKANAEPEPAPEVDLESCNWF
eukprot:a339721_97.p1 GENE.a339721_97~~a339721_97.p1  ORF type:complete len:424 (-),score=138.34 a339721_97:358-1500(-)